MSRTTAQPEANGLKMEEDRGVGLPSTNPTESYWLKEPSPVLKGHRTTTELPKEADVVVVGSGITGSFAGWFLKMGVEGGSDQEGGDEVNESDGERYDKSDQSWGSLDVNEEEEEEEEEDVQSTTGGFGDPPKSGRCVGGSRKEEGGGGQSVVMLEAREVCSGATGRNGGHCQPLVYFAPSIAEFELESYHFLERLIKKHMIPCDWVSQTGVHVYLSQDIFDQAQQLIAQLKHTHPHLASQVTVIKPSPTPTPSENSHSPETTEEENTTEPTLSSLRIPSAKGAILQQHAASVWPYKLVSWLLEHLLAKFSPEEFNLQTNTPVTSLHQLSNPWSSHKWLLSTPRGDIMAKKVILATNGYTAHLLPHMGDLIVPVRGQMAALVPPLFTSGPSSMSGENGRVTVTKGGETEPTEGKIPRLEHAYIFLASDQSEGYNTKDDHVIQRPIFPPPPHTRTDGENGVGHTTGETGGELLFGGGRDFASPNYGVGVWQDDSIDEDVSRYLRSHLSPPIDLQPHTQPNDDNDNNSNKITGKDNNNSNNREQRKLLQATYEWTGIMGFTTDHHPWLGPVPESLGGGEGLWLCAGYNGHGMPVAPLAVRDVVGQVLGRRSSSGGNRGLLLPKQFELTEERVRLARWMGYQRPQQTLTCP